MNDGVCGDVREFIPDLVGRRLGAEERAPIEDHLGACTECMAEFDLAKSLYASRAAIPSGLADRVIEHVLHDRPVPQHSWWGVSAAAVAALALGIGITSQPTAQDSIDVPDFAYEVEDGGIWMSDDGLLAGAPAFDALSDEALLQLLDELSTGMTGGAA